MIPALQNHGRPVASLLLAASSFVMWCALGTVRWGIRPSLDTPYADRKPIYDALLRADIGAKVLAALAVGLALLAFWRSRTRFAKIALVIAILVLLISFVP